MTQPTHFPDSLLVMELMNDRPCTEKEERLKTSVSKQMKHRRPWRSDAHGEDHISQLRKGGVSENPLNVILLRSHQSGEQTSHRADGGDHRLRGQGWLNQETHPSQHVDTSRHHGRRMNQCRNRRRTFHGIRKPDMKRHLRRLAHRTTKDQEHRRGKKKRMNGKEGNLPLNIRKDHRTDHAPNH